MIRYDGFRECKTCSDGHKKRWYERNKHILNAEHNKRLDLIQKENELLDVQARIRQESLSLANAQAQTVAGEGFPSSAQDVANQAAEAASTLIEQELAVAEETAKLKRDAALDALRTDLEAAKFQADTAREVSKLNIDTTKRVADLNDTIRKQNAQQDSRRFEIEQQLAIFRLQSIQAEFALLQRLAPTAELLNDATRLAQAAADAIKYVEAQKQPAAIQGMAAPAMQGVSFTGIDTLNQQLKVTQERINAAKLALNDLLSTKNQQQFITSINNIANSIDAPIKTINQELIESEKTRAQYTELVNQGVRGVVAERLIEVEQLKQTALLQYDAVITELEKKLAVEGTNAAIENQIKKLKDRKAALEGGAASTVQGIQKEESAAARLTNAATTARQELTELTDLANQVEAAADAISSSFAEAFSGLVSGAMTGQEALASFFQGVGDHFMDMAAEMIAKLIEIYILQTVLGFIGGSVGSSGTAVPDYSSGVVATDVFKNTDALGLSTSISNFAFAEGGFVTGPTNALIGEGGEPEYVIPASKMRGAMSRYASGARGSSVIPSGGETSAAQGGGTAGAAPIDVRYTVERINSVDYVTADQFQAGMQQAAAQGAIQGEQLAMRKLQQSASTRNRLGLK